MGCGRQQASTGSPCSHTRPPPAHPLTLTLPSFVSNFATELCALVGSTEHAAHTNLWGSVGHMHVDVGTRCIPKTGQAARGARYGTHATNKLTALTARSLQVRGARRLPGGGAVCHAPSSITTLRVAAPPPPPPPAAVIQQAPSFPALCSTPGENYPPVGQAAVLRIDLWEVKRRAVGSLVRHQRLPRGQLRPWRSREGAKAAWRPAQLALKA